MPRGMSHRPGSARRLHRILEQLATGNRRTRGLAAALDLDVGSVQDELLVATFLGLTDLRPEAHLSRDGLALVFGPNRGRRLADLLREHPQLGPLYGLPLDRDTWIATIRARMPEIDEDGAARLAVELRRVVEPAWRRRPRPAGPEQLALALAADVHRPPPSPDLRAGTDENPDLYVTLLRALLDAGELLPARMRSILDQAGAESAGIGGYIAMATRRGDVRREGESLVVTAGAVARRQLAESATAVALSDPDFRAHLEARLAGRPGDERRFGPWVRRFFGDEALDRALRALLFGRSLASIPVAGSAGEAPPPPGGAFLASLRTPGLFLAFPASLTDLEAGLGGINRGLRAGAAASSTVCRPTAVDPRARVHGGLLSPGEAPVRSFPDLLSLRLRATRSAPAVAFLAAAAAAGRRGPLRLRRAGSSLHADGRGVPSRDFGELVERACAAHRWLPVWGPEGAPWARLADTLVETGILARVGELLVLDEGFFLRLQTDPEHRVVWEELLPLVDLVEAVATPGR